MKSPSAKRVYLLLIFGFFVYFLNLFCMPFFGMVICQIISAVLILVLLVVYIFTVNHESDEREKLLQLQADSAALYVVIAGLLAEAIFYPHTQAAMFWGVLSLAIVGRVITFIYQRYK